MRCCVSAGYFGKAWSVVGRRLIQRERQLMRGQPRYAVAMTAGPKPYRSMRFVALEPTAGSTGLPSPPNLPLQPQALHGLAWRSGCCGRDDGRRIGVSTDQEGQTIQAILLAKTTLTRRSGGRTAPSPTLPRQAPSPGVTDHAGGTSHPA
jgi:hypothetical protein